MLSDELEGYDSINISDSHLPVPHHRIHSMESAFFIGGFLCFSAEFSCVFLEVFFHFAQIPVAKK
jgi:hypothetical protein